MELWSRRVFSLAAITILSLSAFTLLALGPTASARGACSTCSEINLNKTNILVTLTLINASEPGLGAGDYFNVTFTEAGIPEWVTAGNGSTSFFADPSSQVTISGESVLSGPDGAWCMPSLPFSCGSVDFSTPSCTGILGSPCGFLSESYYYFSYVSVPSCISGYLWVSTCGLVDGLYNLQSYIDSSVGGLSSSLSSDFTSLSSSLSTDYNSLSSQISGLATGLSTLTTNVNTLSSTLSSDYSSLSSGIGGLSSSLSSDYASLSSQMSSLGTLGTTNDATVASATVTSVSAFSTSSSNWTPITTASTSEVVSGFTVSVTKGVSTTNGVLYISITKTPTSASSTYAIPIGDLLIAVTPVSGDLHFPYSIPSGATVYVQVVSTTPTTDLVQLQFLP